MDQPKLTPQKCLGILSDQELRDAYEGQKMMYVEDRKTYENGTLKKIEEKFECMICRKLPLYQ
jgi:hypothetical protein